jgi:hypothetical protein
VERKVVAILRVLAESDEPIGARKIGLQLRDYGIELSERAVRYHLQLMDERGLTMGLGEAGRKITDLGREELQNALVSDKIGFVRSRIDGLAYQTTFDVKRRAGDIVVNVSLVPRHRFVETVEVIKPAFKAGYSMGELVAVVEGGERIGGQRVPDGYVGLGTVCSVTLNGVLLRRGLPIHSRFGGLLQIRDHNPLRFTDVIDYSGTTLDPLEIFITSGLTSVRAASESGEGKIGAGFREVPAAALPGVREVLEDFTAAKLGGAIASGLPSQPLLEMPVDIDMAGLVVVGGLTPLAAAHESGIPVINKAMSTTMPFAALQSIWEI